MRRNKNEKIFYNRTSLYIFFCLLYKIKKATFPYYDKISTFISLELMGLFIFYSVCSILKSIKYLEEKIIMYSIFCFFITIFFYHIGYIELISRVYFFMILPMTAFGIIYCFILRDLFSLIFLITILYFFVLFYIGIPYEIGNPIPSFRELFSIHSLVTVLYSLLLKKNNNRYIK